MEPDWQACPFCGTRVAPVPSAQKEERAIARVDETLKLSRHWKARVRFEREFESAFEPLMSLLNSAQSAREHVQARDPARLRGATLEGLRRARALSGQTSLPEEFRTALASIKTSAEHFLAPLTTRLSSLETAIGTARTNGASASNSAKFLEGAAKAMTPNSSSARAIAAGAAIGTFVFPGVGSAIGGAIGGWVAGSEDDADQQAMLDAIDLRFQECATACDECCDLLWDAVPLTTEQGKQVSSFYRSATMRFDALRAAMDGHSTPLPYAEAACRDHLRQVGPHPTAIHLLTMVVLAQGNHRAEEARQIAMEGIRFHETSDPTLLDGLVTAALCGEEYELAEECARRAVHEHPRNLDLGLRFLEVLGAKGALTEAETHASAMTAELGVLAPHVSISAGINRTRGLEPAAEHLRTQIERSDANGYDRVQLAGSVHVAQLYAAGLLQRVSLRSMLEGAVERLLATNNKTKWRAVPIEVREAMNEWFVDDGEVLFFLNWSAWTTGTTGFVVTTSSVQWKERLSSPVRIPNGVLYFEPPSALDGANISILNRTVDMEDADAAVGLSQTFGAICELLGTKPVSPAIDDDFSDEAYSQWVQGVCHLARGEAILTALRRTDLDQPNSTAWVDAILATYPLVQFEGESREAFQTRITNDILAQMAAQGARFA